jgi:hypothetical protein
MAGQRLAAHHERAHRIAADYTQVKPQAMRLQVVSK